MDEEKASRIVMVIAMLSTYFCIFIVHINGPDLWPITLFAFVIFTIMFSSYLNNSDN
jgi:hypothetical protein